MMDAANPNAEVRSPESSELRAARRRSAAACVPDHPLGRHRRRVADRIVFDKLVQVLVLGCGYRKVADQTCSATTVRDRRDHWIRLGTFATPELLVLQAYDRMVGLELDDQVIAEHPYVPKAFPSLWDRDWQTNFTQDR